MIHLDTSFVIRAFVPGSEQDTMLRSWLGRGERIAASTLVWAEFLCGPVDETAAELAGSILGAPEPFDAPDAALAARLFNRGGRRRGSLLDCMIAAVAIRCDASFATANPADFRRFEDAGLKLV